MPTEPPAGDTEPPQTFGPVKPHLSHHRQDHERGWQEQDDIHDGRVPRVDPNRHAPRATLGERFQARVRETEALAAAEG